MTLTTVAPGDDETWAEHMPTESWWICPPEEFAARVAREQARMRSSRFARADMLMTAQNTRRRSDRWWLARQQQESVEP